MKLSDDDDNDHDHDDDNDYIPIHDFECHKSRRTQNQNKCK